MADDDGWGPSTAVHGSGARRVGRAFTPPSAPERTPAPPRRADDGWGSSGSRTAGWSSPAGNSYGQDRAARPGAGNRPRAYADRVAQRPPERGLPWWAALGLLVGIAVVGGLIDTVGSIQVQGGFNIGIVAASGIAILAVKRSHMFPIVIAPPIVYSLAAVFQLYLHGGPQDKKALLDAAANYLVYGFPAIAAASALVLIVAGIRLIARK